MKMFTLPNGIKVYKIANRSMVRIAYSNAVKLVIEARRLNVTTESWKNWDQKALEVIETSKDIL